MVILAIDLYSGNYYPGFRLDLEGMKRAGFRLALIKCSMGGGKDYTLVGGKIFDTVKFFMDYFRGGGFDLAGGYHWEDPVQDWEKQVGYFLDQIQTHRPDVVAYDFEQWWKDWQKWADAGRGKIPWAEVPRCTPNQIKNSLTVMLDLLERGFPIPPPKFVPKLIYLYSWFLETYGGAPKDWPWPAYRKPWIAAYINVPAEHIICETWEEFGEFVEGYVAQINPITYFGNRPAGLKPDEWTWWQFQSRIILPGAKAPYDLSIFNGGEEEYNRWLGRKRPAAELRGWERLYDLVDRLGKIFY